MIHPVRAKGTGTRLKDGTYKVRVTITLPDGAKKRVSRKSKRLSDAQSEAWKVKKGKSASVVTLEALVRSYREEGAYASHEQATKDVFDWGIKPALARWKNLPVAQLTTPMIYQFVREISAMKDDDGEPVYSGRSVQMIRNELKKVLKHGVLIGVLEVNAAREVPLVRSAKRKAPPIVSVSTVEKAIAAEPNPRQKAYWQLLFWTGVRPHKEGSKVMPDDCWTEAGMGWVSVPDSKTDAGVREVPVPLGVYREVLPFLPIKINRSNVLREWREALDRIEADYFPPYQLRSVRFNIWKKMGIAASVRTGAMGHVEEQTGDQHYGKHWRELAIQEFKDHYAKDGEQQ